MVSDYFEETKTELENTIPEYDSVEFHKMQEHIRKELQKKESEFKLLVRSLKVLILGDWTPESKMQLLRNVRDTLLRSGYYAQTIDCYHDPRKHDGLPAQEVLESCCTTHQLIVFIDGEGKGTVTEQEYLRQNYLFQGKVIFFIDESKFNEHSHNPLKYFRIFPAIVTYKPNELSDKVLTYSALRLYRLAEIIQLQAKMRRGISGANYMPWSKRLGKH
ncbi:MAG: hypothetical protein V1644_03430 [Candidatus Micrarchaeota archaeon]